MTKFYELLDRIQKKPGMYIGSRSISNLFMFLCGYQHARDLLETPVTQQEEEFAEFQPWLQKRFAVNTSASWAKIILFYSTDESQAFDQEFLDGTSPRIYSWNQSKISNLKSSSPRIYPWGKSKI